MASFSRFYNAPNYQYTPQFVEQNLGVLDRALARKQKDYDKQAGLLDRYKGAILKQDALTGRDTEVRDKLVKDVQDFSSSMTNLDLTSPENKRKVNEYIQSLTNNEDIKKLNQGLASKAKYDKIKEDLVTNGKYASENDREFAKRFESYLTQSGDNQKFAIDYIGGRELIAPDAPSRPELEKLVDNMKADSITKDRVTGEWINRSTNKVLSYDELMGVLGSNINSFSQTAAGRQMASRAEMNNISFEDQFLSEIDPVAQERAYSEISRTTRSNTAHLLNKKKLDKLDEVKVPLIQPNTTKGSFTGYTNINDYDAAIKEKRNSTNPADIKLADDMEAQKELVIANFANKLTDKEKKVYNAKYTDYDFEQRPELKKLIMEQLGTDSWAGAIKADKNTLDIATKKAIGILEKTPYNKIKDKLNSDIEKGNLFENTSVVLDMSKASNETKANAHKLGKASVDEINFNYTVDDGSKKESAFGNLTDIMKVADPNSFKLNVGNDEVEIEFTTMKAGNVSEKIKLKPKSLTPVVQEFITKLAAENPATTSKILNMIEGKAYSPVPSSSTRSQTADMGFDPKVVGNWNLPQKLVTTSNGNTTRKVTARNLDNGANLTYKNVIDKLKEYKQSGMNDAASALLQVVNLTPEKFRTLKESDVIEFDTSYDAAAVLEALFEPTK